MARFKIVTDSTCYLDPKWLSDHGIGMVPLLVNMGGKIAKEIVDTDNKEFFKYLRESPILPTTSQPSSGEFREIYQEMGKQGLPIISVHISGGISGTVNSAIQAKSMLPDLDITVVDARTTGLGLGQMVMELQSMAEREASKEEALSRLEHIIATSRTYFLVSDLMYLYKGGRIGGAQALIGSALQIKPILTFRDGRIDVLEKVRTERRALDHIIEKIASEIAGRKVSPVAIVFGDAYEKAQALVETLKGRLPDLHYDLYELGPVICTHTGPGVLGIQFYTDPD